MLISPSVKTVARFSSTARSRKASTGSLPWAFAMSAMFWPRRPRLLEEGVVHDRPSAGLRDPAEQLVLQLGVCAASALDDAGADLAKHVGQREQLRLRRAGGRDALAHDVEVIHVPRDREPER